MHEISCGVLLYGSATARLTVQGDQPVASLYILTNDGPDCTFSVIERLHGEGRAALSRLAVWANLMVITSH